MTEGQRIFAQALSISIVIVWVTIFLSSVLIGIIDGREKCLEPWRRYEYVMPGFQIGCWLGVEVEK